MWVSKTNDNMENEESTITQHVSLLYQLLHTGLAAALVFHAAVATTHYCGYR